MKNRAGSLSTSGLGSGGPRQRQVGPEHQDQHHNAADHQGVGEPVERLDPANRFGTLGAIHLKRRGNDDDRCESITKQRRQHPGHGHATCRAAERSVDGIATLTEPSGITQERDDERGDRSAARTRARRPPGEMTTPTRRVRMSPSSRSARAPRPGAGREASMRPRRRCRTTSWPTASWWSRWSRSSLTGRCAQSPVPSTYRRSHGDRAEEHRADQNRVWLVALQQSSLGRPAPADEIHQHEAGGEREQAGHEQCRKPQQRTAQRRARSWTPGRRTAAA